jgi:hypothetical protein
VTERTPASYDFLIVGRLDTSRLAAALAELASVHVDAVNVAHRDAPNRAWDAAVICAYEARIGDVSWSLDIYLTQAAARHPSTEYVAAYLADRLAVPVLYEAQTFPPSAYWLAAPGGSKTRARLYDGPGHEPYTFIIDAVERPVPALPHVRVEAQPEVIREHGMASPLKDELIAALRAGADGKDLDDEPLRTALDRLGAWEAFVTRMGSGWPPDGWYPADYYRHDLEVRDELNELVARLPRGLADRFISTMNEIDGDFTRRTREVSTADRAAHVVGVGSAESTQGWWWTRLPDPPPWFSAPGT